MLDFSVLRVEYHIYSSELGAYKAMDIKTREEAQIALERLQIQFPGEKFTLVPVEKTP